MDLSKLESDAKAFESSIDFWSSWLAIATGLVVLGLVLEYRKDIAEIVRRRPFEWKKLEHLIGAALVTIGVAGELIFQPFMGSAENSLRGVTHHIEALLSKEAGDANERAGEANERAAKIEAAAAWRILNPDQIDRFVRSLSESKHTVEIAFMKGDPESQYLELQLAEAVSRAGWEVGSWEVHLHGVIFFGLAVLGKPDAPAGRALSGAIAAANIRADLLQMLPGRGYDGDGGYHEAEVTLLIGSKFPTKFSPGTRSAAP